MRPAIETRASGLWIQELTPQVDVPWLARCFQGWPHRLVLDSSRSGGPRGGYSYIMAGPTRWSTPPATGLASAAFTGLLADWPTDPRPALPGLPPFQGGLAGLWSYDLNQTLDGISSPRYPDYDTPGFAIGRYDWVIGVDHQQTRAWLMIQPGPDQQQQQREVLQALRRGPDSPIQPRTTETPGRASQELLDLAPQFALPDYPGVTSNFCPEGFQAAIQRAVDYIHAGDCFQINLAQRLQAKTDRTAWDFYERLRKISPAPFAAFFDLGSCQILSTSPERFLAIDPQGWITTRPIKGTRPRGQTPEEDLALQQELLQSPKDRAENVMIVDLLRNDLGRSCRFGSVQVPAILQLESYPYVHHLVSEVRGQLKPGVGPLEALRAAFPGGSVTGAPKIRAMQIIAELEPTPRGAYCGSLGYLGYDGSMDTNILIRTMTYQQGRVRFPVGGGIVADSQPQAEYAETLHKARLMLEAIRA